MKTSNIFLITYLICLFCSLASPRSALAQTTSSRYITITVPQQVIQESLTRILPITLSNTSDKLEGKITVVKISNFKIFKNRITGNIDLLGENLNLVTSVANQDIRVKLGTARIDFDCIADLRYDSNQKILYIRPVAEGIDGDEALRKGDLGKAMLLAFNGQEFPLSLQDLQPVITEAGNKILKVHPNITDIKTSSAALHFELLPNISTTPKN